MLGPAPEDFWQRVVTELARTIWQRETGRTVVAISTVTGTQSTPVTSYANLSHGAQKPWHQQGESRANTDDAAS